MPLRLSAAGTGVSGTLGAWAAMAMSGGIATTALATALSCAFGMLSSLSRVQSVRGHSAIKSVVMNAGAVWLTAFVVALKLHADLPGTVLIGLGVGLAGTTALEAVERGTLALITRVVGAPVVTHDELAERLGDERNRAQAAISEVKVVERVKTETPYADGTDNGSDDSLRRDA